MEKKGKLSMFSVTLVDNMRFSNWILIFLALLVLLRIKYNKFFLIKGRKTKLWLKLDEMLCQKALAL
jgi:hypothetical protein